MASRPGEFEIISRCFAPLAGKAESFALTDDAAVWPVPSGRELVVTTDSIVAGVHFLTDDPPDLVAAKALGVNLSDLAAMGAVPEIYTLAAAWPEATDISWIERFAAGLKTEQERYAISLCGGDTVATPGPMTLTVTAMGTVEAGQALRRNGARSGDLIFVSGTIGDAALGLRCLKEGAGGLPAPLMDYLVERYRRPRARVSLGRRLQGLATSVIDISDGLVADMTHIVNQSSVAAAIDLDRIPLSDAARAMCSDSQDRIVDVLVGGDDYELLFTAPASAEPAIKQLAAELDVAIANIGSIRDHQSSGPNVLVTDKQGHEMTLPKAGYTHLSDQ